VVKAFRRSDPVIEHLQAHNQASFEAGCMPTPTPFMLMPLSNVLGNSFVIILASGWRVPGAAGTGDSGHHRHLHQLRQELHRSAAQLANMFNTIQAALAGAERVFEIIDQQPETPDPADALPLDRIAGPRAVRARALWLPAGSCRSSKT
jgi:ATP-binding cassette, subfamily B, multidrug efflux pump